MYLKILYLSKNVMNDLSVDIKKILKIHIYFKHFMFDGFLIFIILFCIYYIISISKK